MDEGGTHIQLCGRLQVRWNGEPIEGALRGRQGRLLFAYLVLNRARAVRRDEVVEAVWPDERAPAGVESHLAPLLSRLRKLIGTQALEGRSDLRLVLPEGATVDWETLHAELDRARAAITAGDGRAAWEAAWSALTVAERGLLPGLDAPWIEELRTELADRRVEGLELAARAGMRLGGVELLAAERAARQAVEAAPFRESTRAAAMQVLRAQGNVAEALRVYEDMRVLLREELGTTPGPELVALHDELLREPAVAPPAPGPAPEPVPPPAAPTAFPELVERERELTELGRLLADAQAGQGAVALIEGPAGVGKTRLLGEARRRAAAGSLVLGARAGELERDYPFGVVRQLFEAQLADPQRRTSLLGAAAAPAAAVFDDCQAAPEPAGGAGADVSFAVLHGLFWLTLNLAADRPVVLAVDDLHWADRPSLRFLAYLVRRLEGVPVLVATTLRSGETPTDAALLDEILNDPATVAVRPGPLSPAAVRVVVRARFGAGAADAFCAACHETTGGNPLLLRQLLAALESDGVQPVAASAAAVHEIGPRAISRTIALRLARMPSETVAVARAIAVLGERADLPVVAALAGLDEDGAARAVATLVRAEVVRGDPPLGFVHPLVREAVYRELSVGERELQHGRAARALAQSGAPPDVVAMHLVLAPRRGDPWAVGILQFAGETAARQGASDSAVALLRRALEEPPPPEHRAALLLELGLTERLVNGFDAAEHIAEAYPHIRDPEQRAWAAFALAWTMFFVAPPEKTMAFIRQAAEDLPAGMEDMRYALTSVGLQTSLGHAVEIESFPERLAAARADGGPQGEGPGAKLLCGTIAWGWGVTGGTAEECLAFARRAVEGPELMRMDDGFVLVAATITMALADAPETLEVWDGALAEAHRRGSMFMTLTVHVWRGWLLMIRGELAEAEASIEAGLEEMTVWGAGGTPLLGYPAGFLAATRIERGDVAGARAAIAGAGAQPPGSDSERLLLTGEVEVLLAEGRPQEALVLAGEVARISAHQLNPAWASWRSLKAQCLAALGRQAEAVALLEDELVAARAWGAGGVIGHTLRILGTVEGPAGLDRLREAVELLEGTPSRLEYAKALAAMGTALRAMGAAEEAREPLARALHLAEVSGAVTLAEACRAELEAAGATPRPAAVTGVESLTDAERRIAALAAEGMDARSIAQAVFGTPRAVEDHLASAHRKLGVQDAAELGRALAGTG